MVGRDRALVALYRGFAKELVRQQQTFVRALDGKHILDDLTPQVNRGGAWYCLIRLHDAWAHFCREALILSAEGGVRTKHGTLLTRSTVLQAGEDAMKALKRQWTATKQPSRWMKQGPALDVPAIAITAAQLLGISNYRQFSGGIGAAANAPLELKACRNFLAHRHPDTAQHADIQSLRTRINAVSSTIEVGCLPARFPAPGNISVFEDWCIELMDLASAAID